MKTALQHIPQQMLLCDRYWSTGEATEICAPKQCFMRDTNVPAEQQIQSKLYRLCGNLVLTDKYIINKKKTGCTDDLT